MSQNNELQGKIASLETQVDMLEAELNYLNQILIKCGFPEGITSLKVTVLQVLQENTNDANSQKNPNS